MFDFLKSKGEAADVKTIRHQLLQFIKEQLQRWEGEGSRIKGVQLFLSPDEAEKDLYEAVVYADEEGRFQREEVQKVADDYAIGLPQGWTMDVLFAPLPSEAVKAKTLPVAFHIITNRQPTINQPTAARVLVINGEAEQKEYPINSRSGKVFIGREREAQTAEGFARINTIAFPGGSSHPANKYVSRQHAHIEWNSEAGCFFLYADEGGVPPRNKVKVQTANGSLVKLQTTAIGHPLGDGDQVILGETALVLFRYS